MGGLVECSLSLKVLIIVQPKFEGHTCNKKTEAIENKQN
jgi:hypothetical protein